MGRARAVSDYGRGAADANSAGGLDLAGNVALRLGPYLGGRC